MGWECSSIRRKTKTIYNTSNSGRLVGRSPAFLGLIFGAPLTGRAVPEKPFELTPLAGSQFLVPGQERPQPLPAVTLHDALEESLDDLDGTFTYLVSTRDGLGYAKDKWSAKPLVAMETDEVVALASEEVALRSVFTDELERTEPQEHEVMTWSA